ncbi:hypothetical protein JHK85_021146 [Glycine max]|nr:hypothetical protein JHK85_021146 [Glycine max]
MDSAFSINTTAQVALFRALHGHLHRAPQRALLRRNLKCLVTSYNSSSNCCRIPCSFGSVPSPSSLRSFRGLLPRTPRCISSSAASFASPAGGGNGGAGTGDGDGGGGSGGESGDANLKLVGDASQELSALSPDGMVCGGCAATVKRILENQPQVSSASVNLTTETAIVWPVSEAKNAPNWQKQLGEALAEHLTSCGYNSSLRDSTRDNFLQIFERKMEERHRQLRESGRELAVSWALCAVCLVGHFSHFFAAKAPWIHVFHSIGFHLSLSLFTLLGPGRQLILDGLKSLLKRTPNMNTLVGLGALSSFTGWKAFFEEPIMLIAFVLLGRNLEQRAKIKAASDMTGLLSLLPPKARLLLNNGETEVGSVVEVPSDSLSVGDQIIVLPGDRIPADGVVRSGRSTVDESSFTGEPLPVTKVPGSEVAAGSINLNGTLTMEVQRPGSETAMANIVRLVEEAQSREAPVQRLADKVAGHFTYGVMATSAATFTFWSLYGTHILPPALYQGRAVSLALQLACSVLVVACPCALGLATPTAVLVGTSLGAKRGLLLRGGNILEKFAMVDTVVFDKTGTLTVGRPVVTNIVIPICIKNAISRLTVMQLKGNITLPFLCSQTEENALSDVEVLRLAAAVETNSVHPVGKAIVDAAQAANCHNAKVKDGTFLEEPGSGAVATIYDKKVSVGTLEWITRHGVINSIHQEVEKSNNQSFVYVGVDDTLAGLIYFEDEIREDARDVVDRLSKQNIGVYMLSGDKRNAAEHVASLVGIPKEKVTSTAEILVQYSKRLEATVRNDSLHMLIATLKSSSMEG